MIEIKKIGRPRKYETAEDRLKAQVERQRLKRQACRQALERLGVPTRKVGRPRKYATVERPFGGAT